MKRFREISRKIVSIKAFAKRNFLDDEEKEDIGLSGKVPAKRTRDMLLVDSLIDPENTDVKVLYQLSKALLEESESVSSGGTPSLYSALALMEWIVYQSENKEIETSGDLNSGGGAGVLGLMGSTKSPSAKAGAQSLFSPQATLQWAEAHLELWTRKGVAAEEFHLHRAKQLFEQAFKRNPELMTAATQFSYCRVLTLLGEMEAASKVALKILTSYDHDSEYPNYLFFTGGIFKAMGQHEKANNYFFEAAQIGPPKLFTKLEMMIIISRTIEEGTADDDVEEEDAYKMVHAHMLLEGLIDENLEYEDWISHSHTWLSLGDKCAVHRMYSLATDLYGLGIMKDPDAFKKPMLWLRFAKACKRCGRSADGLLAVKQALTYDPFNAQLLRTHNFWSSESSAFAEMVRGPLANILHSVPKELDQDTINISRTQAILKGVLERRGMNLGIGNRRDITRRMTARIGVLLEGTKGGVTTVHPVILTVRPAWSGLITNIRVFDMQNNHLGAIQLRDPFAPMKETGVPRKLNLSLTCRRVTLKVRRTGSGDSDDEEEVVEDNRLVYRKKAPVYFEETVTELKFKFTDLLTGQYTCRRMKLTLNDFVPSTVSAMVTPGGEAFRVNEFTTNEYMAETAGTAGSEETSAAFDAPSTSTKEGGKPMPAAMLSRAITERMNSSRKLVRMNSVTKPVLDLSEKSVMRRLTLRDDAGLPAVTETNIDCAEILREGFRWKELYYMVRIINDVDVTQVTFLQLKSNKIFVFLMAREHIDRTLNINKRLALLMEILEANAMVAPLMQGKKGLRADQAAALENPSVCLGKHCFVNLHPRSEGATLILLDPNSMPIIGTGFEVVDTDGVLLDSRPSSKKVHSIRKSIVGSMRRMPSRRFSASTRSFRNNAIDEFLGGNLNPPPVQEEEEEDSFVAPPMLGKKPGPAVGVLSPIASRASMETSPMGSRQQSTVHSNEASFLAPLKEGRTSTQHSPRGTISATGSESADEGDTFDLAPLRAIPVRPSAVQPVSSSVKLQKRPAQARPPSARVKSLARRNMNNGATLEDALSAAAELQKNMAAFDIQSRSSKSGKVSWAAWEQEKLEEQKAIEAGQLPPSLFVPTPPPADEEPVGFEGEGGELEDRFADSEEEEKFLKHIVDVPWIEELGSIEVVEYVTVDLLEGLMRATVAYIADQYVQLPIHKQFVDAAIAQAVENAVPVVQQRAEEMLSEVLDEVEEAVLEEVWEEAVDDFTEERIAKLNLMAYKAALAEKAAAEAAEKAKAAKTKKPVVIHASKPAAPQPAPKPTPPVPLVVTIPEPEPEVPAAPRVADVAFSQPYRAAPDSPRPAVPVKYNVQRIVCKPSTVEKHSCRPYSKRNTLIPVLGGPVVNKKRHTPEYLLAAQTYQPPQFMGRVSPQSSIYTGTFSRNDVFHDPDSLEATGVEYVGESVKVFKPDRPNSRARLLHFNTIDPLPVVGTNPTGNEELAQPTDPTSPSHRAQGLINALEHWDSGEHSHTPLLTVARIAEANLQPFKPGAPSPKHRRQANLNVAVDDDGAVSISSENTDGSNPVFQTIQRRKLSLPMEEDESVFSVGSASRAGARRSPNKRVIVDYADHDDQSSFMSIGDDSSVSMVSLRSSNGMVSLRPRPDPLQVPPSGARAKEKKQIVKKSLEDYRYLGYVKDRPLVHSSHWRGKLFAYLSSLRGADHLRKHVAMLTKATKVPLTPEESVCALADAAGNVGEVVDRLKSLEFQSEIKLVCRSLHVRSMVCMLEGGEKVFKEGDIDTFGDHGEFDDLSMYSDQLIKKKSNLLDADISRSLQYGRSVPANAPALNKHRSNSNYSKTAPQLQPLHGAPVVNAFPRKASSSADLARQGIDRPSTAAADSAETHVVSFRKAPSPTALTPMDSFKGVPGVLEEGESESERLERETTPSLSAMFHLGREDSLRVEEEDDLSSVSSLNNSLGSVSNKSWYRPPGGIPYPTPMAGVPMGQHFPLTRGNTASTAQSAGSAQSVGSSHSSGTAPSVVADQVAGMQLTPGIRSLLSLPRQSSVMDVHAQSLTVQSKATYVPLKFANTGKSRRKSISEMMNGDSPTRQRGATFMAMEGSADSLDSAGSGGTDLQGMDSGGEEAQGGQLSSPVRDTKAASMNMFSKWGSSSLMNIRAGAATTDAAGDLAGAGGAEAVQPVRHTLMHMGTGLTVDSEHSHPSGTISPVKPLLKHMMSKKASMNHMSSFRLNGRIDDLLEEHGEQPLAVMCRRDFLKAQQDEVLLRSNKLYIRKPIEKKIGIVRTALSFLSGMPEEK